jgi:hypothetical protein
MAINTSSEQLVIANTQLSGPIFSSIQNWPNLGTTLKYAVIARVALLDTRMLI